MDYLEAQRRMAQTMNSRDKNLKTALEQSSVCIICRLDAIPSIVVTSRHSFVTASGTQLSKFLYKVIGEDPCYNISKVICQQCFILLDRLDTYQCRAEEIQAHITTRYKDTKLELLGCRKRLSELIVASLANIRNIENGTTLDVSDELSVTVFHKSLPRKESSPLHPGRRPNINLVSNGGTSSQLNSDCVRQRVLCRKRQLAKSAKENEEIKKQRQNKVEVKIGVNMKKNTTQTKEIVENSMLNLSGTLEINKSFMSKSNCRIPDYKHRVEENNNCDTSGSESDDAPSISSRSSISSKKSNTSSSSINSNISHKSKISIYSSSSSSRSSSGSSTMKLNVVSKSPSSSCSKKSYSIKSKSSSGNSSSSSSSSSSDSSSSNSSSSSDSSGSDSSSSESDEAPDSYDNEGKNESSQANNSENKPNKAEIENSKDTKNAVLIGKEEQERQKTQLKLFQEGVMEKVTAPKIKSETEESLEDSSEPVNCELAEAVLMQNSLASSLFQSFLSTSLWMGSPEKVKPSGSKSENYSGAKTQNKKLSADNSDDLTTDTLNVAAAAGAVGSIKDKKKRLELKNTGQSYINTKGKLVDAKRVWVQDCSRCPLKCNGRLDEEKRLLIFAEFWGLADYNLQREYLAAHMDREERVGPSGHTRTVVLYFLTHQQNRIQVCRQFFLKTLDVSEKASRTVLDKKLKGELGSERSEASLL